MLSLLGSLLGWLLGLITGRSANRDEQLGTEKAENKQLRDDVAVIKRTDAAVKKEQTLPGGTNDPDDLDGVRGPPAGGL